MVHIFSSIKERKKSFVLEHYDWSLDGKKLRQLKDIHMGQVCVIVGNGPSLVSSDLDKLNENKIISFAFNRIYHIFQTTEWRPTYYISQDPWMLSGCVREVESIPAKIKFIPIEMNWYYNIDIKDIQPFHMANKKNKDGYPLFSNDISKQIYNSTTVVFSAIQIAVYMGIKEIYLIGVDHHFRTSMNKKGEIVTDETVKDYFCDEYNFDKEKLAIPHPDESTLTYIAAKQYCDEHDIRIYNATRGGMLEVFPRINYDDLF